MEEKGWLGSVSRRGRSWRPSILYDLASSINPLPSSFAFSILHREASSYTTYPAPLLVLFSFDSCIAPTLSRPSSNPSPRCRVIEFLGIFLCDVEAHEVGSINYFEEFSLSRKKGSFSFFLFRMIETFCEIRFDRFIVGIIIGRILDFCRNKTSMFRECLGLSDSLISPSVVEFLETSQGWGLFD